MLKFNSAYFIFAIVLFLIELYIGLYVHDQFIRPYTGDFLVVILIYCSLKSFLDLPVWTATIMVLFFSFFVETLQYFRIVEKLGLQNSRIASVIIGTSFAWTDLLAYTLGLGLVLLTELYLIPQLFKRSD